jgi:hypothetical protein
MTDLPTDGAQNAAKWGIPIFGSCFWIIILFLSANYDIRMPRDREINPSTSAIQ